MRTQIVLFLDLLVELLLLLLQVVFQLFGALLTLGKTLVAFIDRPVMFALKLDEFLFGLENTLFFDHFTFDLGLFENSFLTGQRLLYDEV